MQIRLYLSLPSSPHTHSRTRYPADGVQPTDLDPSHLGVEGTFDESYVLSCRVRTGRSVRGFRLPPANNRAERREVESVLKDALDNQPGEFKGVSLAAGQNCVNTV